METETSDSCKNKQKSNITYTSFWILQFLLLQITLSQSNFNGQPMNNKALETADNLFIWQTCFVTKTVTLALNIMTSCWLAAFFMILVLQHIWQTLLIHLTSDLSSVMSIVCCFYKNLNKKVWTCFYFYFTSLSEDVNCDLWAWLTKTSFTGIAASQILTEPWHQCNQRVGKKLKFENKVSVKHLRQLQLSVCGSVWTAAFLCL